MLVIVIFAAELFFLRVSKLDSSLQSGCSSVSNFNVEIDEHLFKNRVFI